MQVTIVHHNHAGMLIGIVLDLWIILKKLEIFTFLNVPVHESVMFLYLVLL